MIRALSLRRIVPCPRHASRSAHAIGLSTAARAAAALAPRHSAAAPAPSPSRQRHRFTTAVAGGARAVATQPSANAASAAAAVTTAAAADRSAAATAREAAVTRAPDITLRVVTPVAAATAPAPASRPVESDRERDRDPLAALAEAPPQQRYDMAPVMGLPGVIFARGYQALKEGNAIVLGLSPGNTFYTPASTAALVRFCVTRFARVVVFCPGASMAHNFVAVGVPPGRAKRKALAQHARLCGFVHSALRSDPALAPHAHRVQFVEWARDALAQPAYHQALALVQRMATAHPRMRRELYDTTLVPLTVLARASATAFTGAVPPEVKTAAATTANSPAPLRTVDFDTAMATAQQYLIEEFAWLLAAPHILGLRTAPADMTTTATGAATAAAAAPPLLPIVYHKRFALLEEFAAGEYVLPPPPPPAPMPTSAATTTTGAAGADGVGTPAAPVAVTVTEADLQSLAYVVVEPVLSSQQPLQPNGAA